MKNIKYITLILLLSANLFAQNYSTSGGRFLLLGGGARAGALGGAYSAVAEDGSTIAWNPAGLGAVKAFELSFMYMLYGEDIAYDYAAATVPLDIGTFGMNFIYLGMTPLEEMSGGYVTGNTIDYSDLAFSIAYGKELFNAYSFGVNAKYIRSAMGIQDTADYYKANGIALDFGLLARFSILDFYYAGEKNLRVGTAVQNVTVSKLKYDQGEFPLPMVIKPGLFYKPAKYAEIVFDYNMINDSANTINMGIEAMPEWILSPRAGMKIKDKLKTYTFGVGLKYAIASYFVQLDYAYNTDSYFGTSMISLALRKFSATLAEFGFGDVMIKDVFPAMYKYYTKNPVTRVEIKNNTNIPIKKIKVSMFVNKNMDFPSESKEISTLPPGRKTIIELPAEFNNEILKITEDTPMQAQIKVNYVAEGKRLQLTKTESFKLYNRYSMTWDDFDKLAAFVTPKDTPIRTFARGIVQRYRTEKITGFPGALAQAIIIFDALGATGMTYVLDPQSPYRQKEDKLELVDQIQYPRDTLRFKTGDCDDCSVLYCALLQNIGLNTAFVDVKDHIFMAFDTQIPESEALVKFGDKDLYFIKDGTAWLPVETTMFTKGFTAAWLFAANTYLEASAKDIVTIIDVKNAWKTFYPVTLPSTKWEPPFPRKERTLKFFSKDKLKFSTLGSTRIIDKIKAELKKNPRNVDLLNKLGITYGKIGKTKESREYIKKAIKREPKTAKYYNNLANTYFLDNKLDLALKYYKKAIGIEPNNPNYRINLANLYSIMGDLEKAEAEMEKAEELLSE